VRSLGGLRLAVHYGCHLLRPQPAVRWDDPMAPTKVERLVAAMGATVVDYPTKMQCCGGALDRVGERSSALEFARRKLLDLKAHDVDALVVVCPSCFQQFDLNQAALQRAGEDLHVPVLYLAELMALAGGHAPDEIGLGMHRVDVQPFLDAWSARLDYRERLAASFDVALLDKCDGCRACADDCPVGKVDPSFVPNELIAGLLREGLDGVVADPQVWKCLECYTCQELCPSDIGMAETFRRLKELAMESGAAPESVTQAYRAFLEQGMLGAPKESARRKLGLDPLPAGGGDAVARLLGLAVHDEEVAGR
jgi:Fe-S oxidoreductase